MSADWTELTRECSRASRRCVLGRFPCGGVVVTASAGRPPAGGVLTAAIVDDHRIVVSGLELMLAESSLGIDVVYAGGSPADVLGLERRPDIVLLDLDLEGGPVDPGDVVAMVASGSKVLVVSAMASPWLVRAVLDAGASGLVAKVDTPTHLKTAIMTVMSGEPWHSTELARVMQLTAGPEVKLSAREAEVLNLYASGLMISAVAAKMGITPDTVKTHLKRMRVKFADAGRPAPTAADLYREGLRARIITDRPT